MKNEELQKFLESVEQNKFYGKIAITYENGVAVIWKKLESFKPLNLKSDVKIAR